jgi:1-acyl-sn-glycerol-3-phosphate acyltransferase
MLYRLLKWLGRISFQLFFNQIHIEGLENLPEDKPVLLVSNHPTGFLDPSLAACFLPRTLSFMARGDVFRKPMMAALLRSIHIMPIYRFRDGFEEMKNNQKSFQQVADQLNKNAVIMIFAEGSCFHERRLRPIQRGTARLAANALAVNPDLDIYIVPIAVQYEQAESPHSRVGLQILPAIATSTYAGQWGENNRKTIDEVTALIESALKDKLIHVQDKANDPWAEKLALILFNNKVEPLFPVVRDEFKIHKTVKNAIDRYNLLAAEAQNALHIQIDDYLKKLADLGLTDAVIAQPYRNTGQISLAFSLIPYKLGRFVSAPSRLFAAWFIQNKVKHIEFHNSFRWAIGTFFNLFQWLMIYALGLAFLGKIALLPISLCVLAAIYARYAHNWRQASVIEQRAKQLDYAVLDSLKSARQKIIDVVL